ncbi:MAG: carboxypeptidase-like regulatory domain-containing protein [Planctomycetota bacterium]
MRRALLLLLPLLALALWLALDGAAEPRGVAGVDRGAGRDEPGVVTATGPAVVEAEGQDRGTGAARTRVETELDDRLSGLVVDEDGRGVARAEVWARAEPRDADVPPELGRPRLRARTDAAGRFELEGSWHELCIQAFAPGYRPSAELRLVGVLRPDAPLVLVVRRGCPSVRGLVLDEAGRAVAGARVRLRNVPGTYPDDLEAARSALLPDAGTRTDADGLERRWRVWREASSDARGRFAFDSLPLGSVELLARAEGHAFATHRLWLVDEGPTEVEFRLEPECWIEGRVTDFGGAPVAGARLRLSSSSQVVQATAKRYGVEMDFHILRPPRPGFAADEHFARAADRPEVHSDAEGRYRLPAQPGEWTVEASHPAYGAVQTTVDVSEEGRRLGWNPVLGNGWVLRLRVVDERGRGLPGWRVTLHDGPALKRSVQVFDGDIRPTIYSSSVRLSARSDAEGRLSFHAVPEHMFNLRLRAGSDDLGVRTIDSPDLVEGWREGVEQRIVVPAGDLPTAALSVRVLGPDGRPRGGVSCRLVALGERRGAAWRRTRLRDGGLTFRAVPPGRYSLIVLASGHPPVARFGLELRAGETLALAAIQLEQGLFHVVELEATDAKWFDELEVDLVLDEALPGPGDFWSKSLRLNPEDRPTGDPASAPLRRRFRCMQPLPSGDFELHVDGPEVRPLQRRVRLNGAFVPRLVLQAR